MKMVDQLYGEALEESYAFQNPGSVNHLSEALELEGGDLSLMRGLHGYESRRNEVSLKLCVCDHREANAMSGFHTHTLRQFLRYH